MTEFAREAQGRAIDVIRCPVVWDGSEQPLIAASEAGDAGSWPSNRILDLSAVEVIGRAALDQLLCVIEKQGPRGVAVALPRSGDAAQALRACGIASLVAPCSMADRGARR